jgi:hypothetical protein
MARDRASIFEAERLLAESPVGRPVRHRYSDHKLIDGDGFLSVADYGRFVTTVREAKLIESYIERNRLTMTKEELIGDIVRGHRWCEGI